MTGQQQGEPRSRSSSSSLALERRRPRAPGSGPPGRGPSGRFGCTRESTKVGEITPRARPGLLHPGAGERGLARTELTRRATAMSPAFRVLRQGERQGGGMVGAGHDPGRGGRNVLSALISLLLLPGTPQLVQPEACNPWSRQHRVLTGRNACGSRFRSYLSARHPPILPRGGFSPAPKDGGRPR